MRPNPKADYLLYYDNNGAEVEINNISPQLTAPEYSVDEMDERLKLKFPIMREAVRIARTHKYDMEIWANCGIRVIVYYDYHGCLGLTDLMRLFSQATLVGMDRINFGKVVKIEAIYLIEPKESKTEEQKKSPSV